jgi:hypothetical protein
MAKDASTVFVTKIKALGAGDKTTKLTAALKTAWSTGYARKDLTTVYTNS